MADDDYEVGYRKPPKRTRFQPGQSGNPKGRKKGRKSHKTIIREMFEEKITLTVNGERVTMSRGEAITNVLIAKALKGDMAALRQALRLMEEVSQGDEARQQVEVDLTAAAREFDRLMG